MNGRREGDEKDPTPEHAGGNKRRRRHRKKAQGKTGRVGTGGQIQQEKLGGPSLSATDDCEYTNDIFLSQKEVDVGGMVEAISGTMRAPQTGGDRIRAYFGRRRGARKDCSRRGADEDTDGTQFGD